MTLAKRPSQAVVLSSLTVLVALVYANSLDNPFHYDDYHSIVNNPHLHTLRNLPQYIVDPTMFSVDPSNAMYRPLLLVSFAINHALSGHRVWSYRLLTLVIHLAATILLFRIGERLFGDREAAAVAAAVFAVHPVNAESINYISSRSEVLCGVCMLAALLGFIRWRDGVGHPVWVVVAYAAALLSKAVGIVLPLICLVLDQSFISRARRSSGRLYVWLAIVGGAYLFGVRRFLFHATVDAPVRSFAEQGWSQVKALVFYGKLMVWPDPLSVDHQFQISTWPPDPIAACALALIASLIGVVVYRCRSHPLACFTLAFGLLTLAPASLVPLNVLVNEHRLYLVSACYGLFLAHTFLMSVRRGVSWRWGARLGALAFVAGLGLVTNGRNEVWASPLSLWQNAASTAPLMARPHFYLAEAYYESGRLPEAVRCYRTGLSNDPDHAPGWVRLGDFLAESGDIKLAESAYIQAATASGENVSSWKRLAGLYWNQQQYTAALDAGRKGLERDPADVDLLNNVGLILQELGRPEEALGYHRQAMELVADDVNALIYLGTAMKMLGRLQRADQLLARAVELAPEEAAGWINYGAVCEQLGRRSDAAEAYRRAIVLDGTHAEELTPRISAIESGNGD